MLFAAPWMLVGLTVLSLPILIHLLDRSGGETVDWPTLRFVRIARQQAAQRARLKNILVLLARCLLLALLILAMAQPYVQDTDWARPTELPATLVILLDNSYSMGFRVGVGERETRFDRAKALAIERITGLSLDDEVALVLVNDRSVLVTDQPTRDHARVRELISEARLSLKGTNFAAGLTAAFAVGSLDAPGARQETQSSGQEEQATVREQRQAWREVLLLTDMQRSGWTEWINETLITAVDEPLPVTVIDVSDGETANGYVRQVRQPRIAGGRLSVQAEIAGQGRADGEQATLWVDGQKAGPSEFVPASTGIVKLQTDVPASGFRPCSVQIGEDRLPVDDGAYFVVNSTGRSRLTIVDGDPSAVPASSETRFFTAAVACRPAGSGKVQVDRLSPTRLSTTALNDNGCLVLANVARLDGSALARVENFLQGGGAVLVTLGGRVDIAHYNRDWKFLPIRLSRTLGDPAKSRAYGIHVEAAEHPIFAGALDLSATRFFAFIGSDPTSLAPGAEILASFSNGSPALVEGTFGQGKGHTGGGRVLLLTGAVDADWSNLPYRRVFVPLVDRTVSYLNRRRTVWRNLRPGQPIRFDGPGTLVGRPVVVTAPDGTSRTLDAVLDEQTDSAFVEFHDTDQIGAYQVQAERAFGSGGGFAVNLDTRESVLTPVDPEDVREAFGEQPVRFVADRRQAVAGWKQAGPETPRERRREYWPWLLVAAFVTLVIETLLANFYTRRRAVRSPLTTEYMSTSRAQSAVAGRR